MTTSKTTKSTKRAPIKSHIRVWVRALRSQKYLQTTGTLKRVNSWLDGAKQDTSYCCLGVACEIYRDATKRGEWTDGLSQPQFVVTEFLDSSRYVMPKAVAQYFGLKPDPVVTRGGRRNRLSVLNDKGVTFKEIAALITQEFLK